MAFELPISETPTNGANPYIDALVAKGAWSDDDGGTVTIKVSFASGATDRFMVTGDSWLDPEMFAARSALNAWAAVANIEFLEVPQDEADIRVWRVTGDTMARIDGGLGGLGLSDIPWDPSDKLNVYFNSDGDGWAAPDGLIPGGYAYATLLHEFGHALGLAHPHGQDPSLPDGTAFPGVDSPGSRGDFNLNQGVFTVMTYNDGWQTRYPNHIAVPGNFGFGWQASPMAFDIAAVTRPELYGPRSVYAEGDDPYFLPTQNAAGTGWRSIWDTGGVDTLSAEGAAASAFISLQPAALRSSQAGGVVSYIENIIGGFTIANGVTIENATGGDFNDTLLGNSVSNVLTGGKGDDTLHGGAKGDQLIGGEGFDAASYLFDLAVRVALDNSYAATGTAVGDTFSSIEGLIGSTRGDDVLAGDMQDNIVKGEGGSDKLYGRDGNDSLYGGDGDDLLSGSTGENLLDGGDGEDFVSYRDVGRIEIALNGSFANGGAAANDQLVSIERVSGSDAGSDLLLGSTTDNRLYGNGGDDEVYGLSGNDLLKGGDGADTLSGGAHNDELRGEAGADTLFGKSGNDTLVGGSGADTLVGSSGADQYRYEARSDLGDSLGSFSKDDTFAFQGAAFNKLKPGFLAPKHLKLGTNNLARDKDDFFIFETDAKRLWFDADGSGIKKPVLVVDMDSSVTLNVNDILII